MARLVTIELRLDLPPEVFPRECSAGCDGPDGSRPKAGPWLRDSAGEARHPHRSPVAGRRLVFGFRYSVLSSCQGDEIPFRDDSDQTACLNHRQASNLALDQHMCGLSQRRVWSGGDNLGGHNLLDHESIH